MSLEIDIFGDLIWKNERGQWHREEGPAFITSYGHIAYYFYGDIHRLDGPAVIYYNDTKSYYIHDRRYCKKDYYSMVKKL